MHVGLDFGMCFSKAALLLNGQLQMVMESKNPASKSFGHLSIPSVVYIKNTEEMVVGWEAEALWKDATTRNPDRYVLNLKEKLGQGTAPLVPGHTWLCQDLVASVLHQFKVWADQMVESAGPIHDVVLTVPVRSHEEEMMRAARKAEFDGKIHFLPEPVAAAIYYDSLNRFNKGETLLIYDLGGGTFDTAIVRKEEEERYKVLGDNHLPLGGRNFDEVIRNQFFASQQQIYPGLSWLRDSYDQAAKIGRNLLGEECTRLKHDLNPNPKGEFNPKGEIKIVLVDEQNVGHELIFSLDQHAFNQMISAQIEETFHTCEGMLQNHDLTWDDIDHVVLSGGSSRIHDIESRLRERYTGNLAHMTALDLDLAVCKGAALYRPESDPPPPPPPERRQTKLPETISSEPQPPPPPPPELSLRERIQHAKPGDQLVVEPGTYQENLVVDKPLTIVGRRATGREVIILASKNAPCLEVNTPGGVVTLKDVTIQGVQPQGQRLPSAGNVAVYVTKGSLKLEQVTVKNSGVLARGAGAEVLLKDSKVEKSPGDGVVAENKGRADIIDSRIQESQGWGVKYVGGQGTIRGSTLEKNRRGNLFISEDSDQQVARSFPPSKYAPLERMLAAHAYEQADVESMRLLAQSAYLDLPPLNHLSLFAQGLAVQNGQPPIPPVISSRERARLLPREVVAEINAKWNRTLVTLPQRKWVREVGFSSKASKPFRGQTLLQWRLNELGFGY